MALSPTSRSRARAIREMARDLNRTNHSAISSTGSNHGSVPESTLSDFDPENEALMSTRQMDNTSQRLPEIRASAKKYSRYTRPDLDFVINTSAVDRAFPDFTGGGSSSEDSASIEIGRGNKKINSTRLRQSQGQSNARYDAEDSVLSSKAMIGTFEVLSTPPARPRGDSAKITKHVIQKSPARRDSPSQKENQPPLGAVKSADYGSGGSRQSSGDHRPTLKQMHARVRDENEDSFMEEDRPATVTFTNKATRFGNGKNRQSSSALPTTIPNIPQNFTSTDSFMDQLKHGAHQDQQQPYTNNSATNTGQQSIALPDLPNISELVSGVYQDGTPVFSRSGKASSRFKSPNSRNLNRPSFAPLDGIPVPEEERAIFVSLKLLQEKVAFLEDEKAGYEQRVEELQGEVYTLRAENNHNAQHRRSDSALGLADSGSDGDLRRNGRYTAEKSKLEATVKTLQDRIDTANRKVSVNEISIKNLTQERDNAVSQLGVAYYTTNELKSENETLKNENEKLKAQVAAYENETQKWAKKEAGLKKKVQRREEAVKEVREMTREIWELKGQTDLPFSRGRADRETGPAQSSGKDRQTSSRAASKRSSQSKLDERVQSEIDRIQHTNIQVSSTRGPESSTNKASNSETRAKSRSRSRRRSDANSAKDTQGRKTGKTVVVQSYIDSDDAEQSIDITEGIDKSIRDPTGTGRDTAAESSMSIFENREVAALREILEAERAKHRERQDSGYSGTTARQEKEDTIHSHRSSSSARGRKQSLPRKSSMKSLSGRRESGSMQHATEEELTGRFSIKNGELTGAISEKGIADDHTTHSRASSVAHRRRSEPVKRNAREMTSAFIIPDITIDLSTFNPTAGNATLSTAAKKVLNNIAGHDATNCTVCRQYTTSSNAKETLLVKKPVPVSERMPEHTAYNEEPTLRPSQPPSIALATVLKSLEDRLAHLKLEIAKWQSVYNAHDASLAKRDRKRFAKKLETLLKQADQKADQIYALYDVLEGQKQAGREMGREEVEVTLQNIGIDVSQLTARRAADDDEAETDDSRQSDEASSADSDDDMDLPWEGLDGSTNPHSARFA